MAAFRDEVLATKGAREELQRATLASLAAAKQTALAPVAEDDDAEAMSEIMDVIGGAAPGEKNSSEEAEE
jgi:hypothetical protein